MVDTTEAALTWVLKKAMSKEQVNRVATSKNHATLTSG
jgi:hypothetical protein